MTDAREGRVHIELQYFEGCPHWEVADARLRAVTAGRDVELGHRLITTPEEAEAHQFRGSPSILIDGRDPFASGDEPVGLSCRVYQTPDGPAGAPTVEQLEAAVAAGSGAVRPRRPRAKGS